MRRHLGDMSELTLICWNRLIFTLANREDCVEEAHECGCRKSQSLSVAKRAGHSWE